MNTTMNTGAASLSDDLKRAAITACALMIKGICLTRPNAEWTGAIEDRIQFMLKQMQAGAAIAAGGAQEPAQSWIDGVAAELWAVADVSGFDDFKLAVGGFLIATALPRVAATVALTDEQREAIMEQAQVFASAWSLVGGPFDYGGALETAEQEKENLRALLAAASTSANVAQGAEAVASLRRIAHELRTYNPAADEYKGEHIHKVWAREIEAVLASVSGKHGEQTKLEFMPVDSMQHAIVYGSMEAIAALKARMERDYRAASTSANVAQGAEAVAWRLRLEDGSFDYSACEVKIGADMTDEEIFAIADDNDSGRAMSGRRLFSEGNLLLFARALLARQPAAIDKGAVEQGAELTLEQINEVWKRANGEELENTEFGAMVVAFAQAFAAPPAQTATTDDARDAIRYRWMRDFNVRCKDGVNVAPPCEHAFASLYSHAVGTIPATRLIVGEELDRTIDAALTAAQSASGDTK